MQHHAVAIHPALSLDQIVIVEFFDPRAVHAGRDEVKADA